MKLYLNPLLEKYTLDLSYFNPKFYFEAEWCLDMHGFLTRDELKERIDEINKIVEQNPLMSERLKKAINFGLGLIILLLLVLSYSTGTYYSYSSTYSVIGIINVIIWFFGRYMVDKEAKNRSVKFTTEIKKLFDKYNQRDIPTANWKLKWRKVLSYHKVEMKDSKGKVKPVFAEQAEIELEINDALSDITECTVRLNLHKLGKLRRNRIQNLELEKILDETKDEISAMLEKLVAPSKDAENLV